MWALVTGASSGIGRDMARQLSKEGYDLILVARDEVKLKALQEEIVTKSEVISLDLANSENCMKLYQRAKDKNPEIVINNAGFGVFGDFVRNRFRKRNEFDSNQYYGSPLTYKIISARYGGKRSWYDCKRVVYCIFCARSTDGSILFFKSICYKVEFGDFYGTKKETF